MKRMSDLAGLPLTSVAVALTVAACGGGGTIRPERGPVHDASVASDMLVFASGELALRVPATCDGSECTYSIEGEAIQDPGRPTTVRSFGEATRIRNGVEIGTNRDSRDVQGLGTLSVDYYGGWMQYSAFGVSYGRIQGEQPVIDGVLLSVSIGKRANGNPLAGSAVWTGAMAGRTWTDATVEGDATITVDFSQDDVDVRFDEIADIDSGRSYADMEWRDLPMRDGAFSGAGIEGRFYGPEHQEVGGVFERDMIVGGFGAARSAAAP